jgi:hypothetical protein
VLCASAARISCASTQLRRGRVDEEGMQIEIAVEEGEEDRVVVRLCAWRLEVVVLGEASFARWIAPSGEFFEVEAGKA